MPPLPADPGAGAQGPRFVPRLRDLHPYDPAVRPLSKAQTWPLSRIRNRTASHNATSNSAPPAVPDRSRDATAGGGGGNRIGNGSGSGGGSGSGSGGGSGTSNGVAADLAEALRTVASVSQPIPLSDAARPPVVPGAAAGGDSPGRRRTDRPPDPPAGQVPLVPAIQEAAVPGRVSASERGLEVPLDPAVIGAPRGGPSGGSTGSSGSSGGFTTNRVTNSNSTSSEEITPPSDETRGDGPGGGSGDGSSGDNSGGSSPSSHSTLSSASRRALIRPIKIGPIKYCPYSTRSYSPEKYDEKVVFQKMVILLVLRHLNIDPAVQRYIVRQAYFRGPWRRLMDRCHRTAAGLRRPSWVYLTSDLERFPRYKQDVISLREACQGCGRDHPVCNSYTDILLYGRRYDLDTFVSDNTGSRSQEVSRQHTSTVLRRAMHLLSNAYSTKLIMASGKDCFKSAIEFHEVYHMHPPYSSSIAVAPVTYSAYRRFLELERVHFRNPETQQHLRAALSQPVVDIDVVEGYFYDKGWAKAVSWPPPAADRARTVPIVPGSQGGSADLCDCTCAAAEDHPEEAQGDLSEEVLLDERVRRGGRRSQDACSGLRETMTE
ncbi:hypothetical protein EHS25_003597 [Saitozyma podzolica]|uniref:Uncharacterized protein n=1 Tax=Saitozyma podzolica TaxID=1890683 RepID=A0A427Y7P6_9TREE|nr:hypothetical protein EHS25_003597 [Saitozyma podzolica]